MATDIPRERTEITRHIGKNMTIPIKITFVSFLLSDPLRDPRTRFLLSYVDVQFATRNRCSLSHPSRARVATPVRVRRSASRPPSRSSRSRPRPPRTSRPTSPEPTMTSAHRGMAAVAGGPEAGASVTSYHLLCNSACRTLNKLVSGLGGCGMAGTAAIGTLPGSDSGPSPGLSLPPSCDLLCATRFTDAMEFVATGRVTDALTALRMLDSCCICSSAFDGNPGRTPGDRLAASDMGGPGGGANGGLTLSGDGAMGGCSRGEATWKLGGRGGGGGPVGRRGSSGDSGISGRTCQERAAYKQNYSETSTG